MPRNLVTMVIFGLVFLIWGASFSTMAASAASQQTTTSEGSPSEEECQINQSTLDYIESAKLDLKYTGENYQQAADLIEQAEVALMPPDCDDNKSLGLADRARQLADSQPSKPPSDTVMFRDCRFPQWPKKIMDFSGGTNEIGFTTVIITLPTALVASAVYGAAKTSGTSGCEGDIAYHKIRQYRYVAITRDNLARDMARGGGEYLTAMAYLYGCPIETKDSFAQMTQRNFSHIIPQPDTDPETILINIEAQIAADPLLAAQCSGIS